MFIFGYDREFTLFGFHKVKAFSHLHPIKRIKPPSSQICVGGTTDGFFPVFYIQLLECLIEVDLL
jgi:hypothetical protein